MRSIGDATRSPGGTADSAMASNPSDGPETVAVNCGSKALAVSAHEASQ